MQIQCRIIPQELRKKKTPEKTGASKFWIISTQEFPILKKINKTASWSSSVTENFWSLPAS